jgi:hypothetical protein
MRGLGPIPTRQEDDLRPATTFLYDDATWELYQPVGPKVSEGKRVCEKERGRTSRSRNPYHKSSLLLHN